METLLQRLIDRYEVDELCAVLNLSVTDIAEAFEDKIEAAINEGTLDV